MPESFDQIFEQFSALRVLVIGDVMVDQYVVGEVERISPEAPVPVVKAKHREFRLGGAANVALNILAMGAKPVICAVVGDDERGEQFISRLDEREMEKGGMVISKNRNTTVKTRVMSGSQHIVRVDFEDDHLLNEEEQNQLKQKISDLIEGCHAIIFEDYDKGAINEEIIRHTIQLALERQIPTIVDPKLRNFRFYENATFFKPNLKELKEGLKINIDSYDLQGIIRATQELHQKLHCEGSLVTLSSRGVFIDYKGERHHIPAHVRSVSDVSGAGDTVVSLLALGVAAKLEPRTIAELANLGGGLVCEHLGVVPVDKNQLLEEANRYLVY